MPFELAINWADATIAFSNVIMAGAAMYAAITWKKQLVYRDLTEERKLLFQIWKELNATAQVYRLNANTNLYTEATNIRTKAFNEFISLQKAFRVKKRELNLEKDERFNSSISTGFDSIPNKNLHQFIISLEEATLRSIAEREKAMQHIYSI